MNLKVDMLNERKALTKIKPKKQYFTISQNSRLIYDDRKQISSCLGTEVGWKEDYKGARGNFWKLYVYYLDSDDEFLDVFIGQM